MKSQRITIYDIADEAGVSITTVSRALSQKNKVKPETYNRIMRIVHKYNFQPNEAAKRLAETKRTLYRRRGKQTELLRTPDISSK